MRSRVESQKLKVKSQKFRICPQPFGAKRRLLLDFRLSTLDFRLFSQPLHHQPGGYAVRVVAIDHPELLITAAGIKGLRGSVVLRRFEINQAQLLPRSPILGGVHERAAYTPAAPARDHVNGDDVAHALRFTSCNQKTRNFTFDFRHPSGRVPVTDEFRQLLARVRNPGWETSLVDLMQGVKVGCAVAAELQKGSGV